MAAQITCRVKDEGAAQMHFKSVNNLESSPHFNIFGFYNAPKYLHYKTIKKLHDFYRVMWELRRVTSTESEEPKNKELFRIEYMDRPRMGSRKSLDNRLRRRLKTRSCSGLHTLIGHA